MTNRGRGRVVSRLVAVSVVAATLGAEIFVVLRGEWQLTAASLGVVFASLGSFITFRVPGHRFGPLYLTVGGVSAAFQVSNHLGTASEVARFGYLISSWAWAVPAVLVVTFGLLLLPDGRLPSRRWRWTAWSAATCVALAVVAMPFDPEAPSEHGAPFGVWPQPIFDVALLLIVVSFLVAFVAGIAAVIVRFRRARRGPVRRQLQLVALAAIATLVIYVGQDPITSTGLVSLDVLMTFALGLIPLAVTVGIVKHGMFDLGRLVSRVVSYVLVTVVLAGVYGVVALAPSVFLGAVDTPDYVVAMATLVAAAMFRPVRSRVQELVDRRFNRSRYDAVRELDRFGAQLRDELDQDTIVAEVRFLVSRTLEPASYGVLFVGRSRA